MATQIEPKELDLQEQIARIRKTQAEIDKMFDERNKLQVETRYFPAALIFQAMIAAAALLGAGATITKVFFSH